MRHVTARAVLSLALTAGLCLASCGAKAGREQADAFSTDADYYHGLAALDAKDVDKAGRLLRKAAKDGTPLVARRALEELAQIGSAEERIRAARTLHDTYGDEQSLATLSRALDEGGQHTEVVRLTDDADVTICDNELAYLRCVALAQQDDPRFDDVAYQWFTGRAFSDLHQALYSALPWTDPAITLRAQVYGRAYDRALETARLVLDKPGALVPQLASDAGKALLYGSSQYAANAALLDRLTPDAPLDCRFYLAFYAGRLYDRAGNTARSQARFKAAMDLATTDALLDNALWYYLTAALKESPQAALDALEEHAHSIRDPSYYDDFFDSLSLRLISRHDWTDYYRASALIDGHASDEAVAKFCYVSARLMEQGFLDVGDAAGIVEKSLLHRALSSGSEYYYRLLAANRLGLTGSALEDVIFSYGTPTSIVADSDAEHLMDGYVAFGLASRIYAEWQRFGQSLGTDCIVRLCTFLDHEADGHPEYYEQALRMASRRANYPDAPLTPQLLRLAFPQDFGQLAQAASERFGVEPWLLLALLRSESFFAPQAKSHAGATGLSQLMDATAADIAAKLKMPQYDLLDPETNILFGAFYLEEMCRRMDGPAVLGLFAYNAGISRVRSWQKSAAQDLGTDPGCDLFLEALPYAETREYGRKVTAAAALYAWLYYDTPPATAIASIMGD